MFLLSACYEPSICIFFLPFRQPRDQARADNIMPCWCQNKIVLRPFRHFLFKATSSIRESNAWMNEMHYLYQLVKENIRRTRLIRGAWSLECVCSRWSIIIWATLDGQCIIHHYFSLVSCMNVINKEHVMLQDQFYVYKRCTSVILLNGLQCQRTVHGMSLWIFYVV